ncbi:hypothetical protein H206_05505 [Candidatus Electrothrix aarhusensis]|uniref:Uncharacterized protein n=1 Tax=Candidatus Electrothrix aarhusensis TaxID=1859131 RepID=A0A444J488_9BACT|nr:hypothetical protein H206_05505 [Candidatus Electrothrix aarhusensis]
MGIGVFVEFKIETPLALRCLSRGKIKRGLSLEYLFIF